MPSLGGSKGIGLREAARFEVLFVQAKDRPPIGGHPQVEVEVL
jgi:hypothetical protein